MALGQPHGRVTGWTWTQSGVAQVLQTLLVRVTVGQSLDALETEGVVVVAGSEVIGSVTRDVVEAGEVCPFTGPLIFMVSYMKSCSCVLGILSNSRGDSCHQKVGNQLHGDDWFLGSTDNIASGTQEGDLSSSSLNSEQDLLKDGEVIWREIYRDRNYFWSWLKKSPSDGLCKGMSFNRWIVT